ncbi:hypothetical protein [Ensifer soli]|uniref:hypothetical protein n=1 Tax=Ciceribacter sp. sgz301302 TaxID=3342379 RepID=UPI0035B790E5
MFRILTRRDDEQIRGFLERHIGERVDVTATIVGARIEIRVFEDGNVYVSWFIGKEDVENAAFLDAVIDGEIADEGRLKGSAARRDSERFACQGDIPQPIRCR